MKFENKLKGNTSEALVRTLLGHAGIKVVPLGIEQVIREVTELSKKDYRQLDLPNALRRLPDFFATDGQQHWLIEVKYRAHWNEKVRKSLEKGLRDQTETWSPLYLILFLGETHLKFKDYPSAWLQVAKLVYENGNLMVETPSGQLVDWGECDWQKSFWRIQDIFRSYHNKKHSEGRLTPYATGFTLAVNYSLFARIKF